MLSCRCAGVSRSRCESAVRRGAEMGPVKCRAETCRGRVMDSGCVAVAASGPKTKDQGPRTTGRRNREWTGGSSDARGPCWLQKEVTGGRSLEAEGKVCATPSIAGVPNRLRVQYEYGAGRSDRGLCIAVFDCLPSALDCSGEPAKVIRATFSFAAACLACPLACANAFTARLRSFAE